jgi:hypothetical protein
VIDPLERWQPLGDKPDYAGLLTYGGLPYTQDAAELRGVDVAIVGARPTTSSPTVPARASPRARSGRRAARRGRIWRRRSTPFASFASSTSAMRR